MTVVSSVYYVPSAKVHLLSPQILFNAAKGVSGRFVVEECNITLSFHGIDDMVVDYDTRSHLPTTLTKNHTPGQAEISPEVHLVDVLSDENTNLSPAQKLLLHWH